MHYILDIAWVFVHRHLDSKFSWTLLIPHPPRISWHRTFWHTIALCDKKYCSTCKPSVSSKQRLVSWHYVGTYTHFHYQAKMVTGIRQFFLCLMIEANQTVMLVVCFTRYWQWSHQHINSACQFERELLFHRRGEYGWACTFVTLVSFALQPNKHWFQDLSQIDFDIKQHTGFRACRQVCWRDCLHRDCCLG